MNIGIWIRVSTEDQARGESPKNHEARARMYAELKGWNVVDLYDLSGVSGKKVSDHPEARRMLNDVANGKIQGLIFSKLARLARNTKELLEISDYFQSYNANLVSLEESLDTSTPAGRLLYTVIGALAQWEREEISARVAASVPVRARQGKPVGGKGPFGFMWEDRELVLNPNEAPVVERAYEIFLETGKLLTTCTQLESEGYRSRGGIFRPVTLKRILTDTVYRGLRRANYSKSKGDKKSWTLKPKEEWVVTQVTPIVSEQIWNLVNSKIQQNAETMNYNKIISKDGKYLFSGLLKCHCGTKLYVNPYKGMKIPRYLCRTCRLKINEDVIEGHFVKALKKMVLTPEELVDFAPEEQKEKTLEQRLDVLKRELRTVNAGIDNLLNLISAQVIDQKTFTERFAPLRVRRDQISAEIPRIQGQVDFVRNSEVSRGFLLEQATTYAAMWEILNEEERRILVQEMIDCVEVGEDFLNFVLAYAPSLMAVGNDTHNPRDSSTPRA